jgi:hypothetical protein
LAHGEPRAAGCGLPGRRRTALHPGKRHATPRGRRPVVSSYSP